MPRYLGIDTSNYTTSAALYDSDSDEVVSVKKLLPVAEGAAGLRQSDAVFSHVRQLPQVLAELLEGRNGGIRAVCASARPRSVEGSYMPAFLVGEGTASAVANALGVPALHCSHQEGHIVSAAHSAGAMSLLREEFYAFHVSGGTTECLLVRPDGNLFSVELVAHTLDLNAGQLVDRVGVALGLPFPCGMALDALSLACDWEGSGQRVHPSFAGADCHFSGAQNQCETLLKKGAPPELAARYAIEYICAAIGGMTERVMDAHGMKPVLYAGGVMSNSIIRAALSGRYGGRFASPEFSSDNASGPAIIASMLTADGKG